MEQSNRVRMLAYLVIALAALIAASNALWYLSYRNLSAEYNNERLALENVTARLIYAGKLLNVSIKTIQAYRNLTALLNTTLTAVEAGKIAAVTNVSLELDVESIKLMALATNAISEANQTTDPVAREYLVMVVLNATNATMEGLKALAFLGSYMGANTTYFQYIASAEKSVQEVASLAFQLRSPSTTVSADSVTSNLTAFVSNVLAAERILASLAHPLSTS